MAKRSSKKATRTAETGYVYQLVDREKRLKLDAKVHYEDHSLSIIKEEKRIQQRPRHCSCGDEIPTPDLVIRKVILEVVG